MLNVPTCVILSSKINIRENYASVEFSNAEGRESV